MFTEHVQTYHQQKLQNASQMGIQIGGQNSYVFKVSEVPTPGWAPGRPQTGSKAQKHATMEPKADFRGLLEQQMIDFLWLLVCFFVIC